MKTILIGLIKHYKPKGIDTSKIIYKTHNYE